MLRTRILILILSLLPLFGLGCRASAGDPAAVPFPVPTWDYLTPAPAAAPRTTPETVATDAPAPATGPYVMAYIRQGNLFVANLARDAGMLVAGPSRRLSATGDITYAAISPDGQHLLYARAPQPGNNELYVATFGARGAALLAGASDLPPLAAVEGRQLARVIHQVAWLPDSRTIAFNSATIAVDAPAVAPAPAGDLWLVAPGAPPQEHFPAGTGAHYFTISPQNQVLMAAPGQILRAALDRSLSQAVVTYEPGGAAVTPRPQWAAGGREAYVAIPTAGVTALWRIPRAGPAQHLANVAGHDPLQPLQWTPDGQMLAYAAVTGTAPHPLLLAAADGSAQRTYAALPRLDLLLWSPGARHFLYGGAGYYAVGAEGVAPAPLTLPPQWQVWDVRWLTEATFLVGASGFGAWELAAGHVDGTVTPLLSFNREITHFDVWPSADR